MKQFLCKRIISGLLVTCCLSIPTHYAYGLSTTGMGDTQMSEEAKQNMESMKSYFDEADASVQALALKIARQTPITLDEVEALPEGALNARYNHEITLLFFATTQFNLQAIDVLLAGGADPYAVDYPSRKSVHDFTFYITDMNTPGGYADTMKFRTELMRIYLKNGGDPNHELPSTSHTHLLVSAILMRNIVGARMLIDAGADPLKTDGTDLAAPTMLAIRRDTESNKLLKDIICKGAYNNATKEQVENIIIYLRPFGPVDPVREERHRRLAMYILKRHPDYQDSKPSKMIFNGPIPWKKILETSDKELCDGQ